MNKYLVITIDVEPDCTPTWRYSDPLTFRGVTEGITKRLQPLFNKYETCPTYLINNVVLEDKESTQTFLHLSGRFELGTHLHSEFIEPEREFANYAGKKGEANQCYLKPEVEFEKMKNITRMFENNFGKKPTSFRAGRFSAGINTINSLLDLGYKVDTSVTPHIKWHDKTRKEPIDYTHVQEQPYFIKNGAYPEPDSNGKILEVPVSIIKTRRFFRSKPIWLRPHYSDFNDFIKIVETQTKRSSNKEDVVFNLMFHNVEVMPKLSPYCQSEAECKDYLDAIESFLAYCKDNKIQSLGLSSLYEIFRK